MFSEITTIIALLALGALGWWYVRARAAAARKLAEEDSVFERHDHARAYEQAKAEAELSRWSGPH